MKTVATSRAEKGLHATRGDARHPVRSVAAPHQRSQAETTFNFLQGGLAGSGGTLQRTGCWEVGRSGLKVECRRSSRRAFTLIELLVVIVVAGILAALAVPAIKEFGRSNQQVAATRQLLDDLGRARQLAIANRTTVYMVFLPDDYLKQTGGYGSLSQQEQERALQLAAGQDRAYALVSLRSIGDQPGQSHPQYLSEWKTLPSGWIFSTNKFLGPTSLTTYTNLSSPATRTVSGFAQTNSLPFPSATAPTGQFWLPYIAFDSSGGLVSARDNGYEIIPLARGGVDPDIDAAGNFVVGPAIVEESPAGNGFEVPNLIVVDGLTGRAKLETREIE